MKQYELKNKTLVLKVNKSPIIVRGILFFLAIASFLLPILGTIASIADDKEFHIGFLIAIFLFGLIGFYLLRISLWNTYGKETINFFSSKIEYEADYFWFKDDKKSINTNRLSFSIKKLDSDSNHKGTLIIETESETIESVIKLPIHQIEEIIEKLQPLIN